MKSRIHTSRLLVAIALALFTLGQSAFADPAGNITGTETVVLLRHGEKPPHEIGQLSIKGLNRSLALPAVLIAKYGKPNYIFAPNPAVQVHGKQDSNYYCYIRPLATIEPTAIQLNLPVNTQIGFNDIQQLQNELTKPTYQNSLIFVAWEHVYLDEFAKNLVQACGVDRATVPAWPSSDYDTIFVIRIQQSGGKPTATFSVDHEGLTDKLSDMFPAPAAN